MGACVRRAGAIACVLSLLSVLGMDAPGAAGAGARFGRSVAVRMPRNAAGYPDAFFLAAACVRPGSCVAGGGYLDKAGFSAPMIARSVNGRWGRATELRIPARYSAWTAYVSSISCTGPGTCVAVGAYSSPYHPGAFIATESRGRWRAAQPALPRNSARFREFSLDAVDCTSARSCVAAGEYADRARHFHPMVVTESHGRWGRARELALPADAAAQPYALVHSISCPRPGYCVLGGAYLNPTLGYEAMLISQTAGRWHRAARLKPPRDASAYPFATVQSVSCTGPGACLAVGKYQVQRAGRWASFAVTESGGRWRRTVAMPVVPANADWDPQPTLDSVTCSKPGSCLALGSYYARRGAGTALMIVVESNGKWTAATEIRRPAGVPHDKHAYSAGGSIACTRSGYCAAVSQYQDGANSHGFNTWPIAAETPLPTRH